MDIETFLLAYLDAAAWSSTDENGDNFDCYDFADSAISQAREDCEDFLSDARTRNYVWEHMEQSGHDFWLTRCHHGAGFWDRGYPAEKGEYLTDRAHAAGSRDVFKGDDDLLYFE